MARSLGPSKLLLFGPSGVRISAEFTAEALLEPLFGQSRKGDSRKLNVTSAAPHPPERANLASKVCGCYSPPLVTGILCVTSGSVEMWT